MAVPSNLCICCYVVKVKEDVACYRPLSCLCCTTHLNPHSDPLRRGCTMSPPEVPPSPGDPIDQTETLDVYLLYSGSPNIAICLPSRNVVALVQTVPLEVIELFATRAASLATQYDRMSPSGKFRPNMHLLCSLCHYI